MAGLTESKDPIQIPQLPSGSVKDFIPFLAKHPKTPIPELLEPFKAFESGLRKVYAQQPDHDVVKDGHINLVPIFEGHEKTLKVRARDLEHETDDEKSKYLMALKDEDRKPNGSPAVVTSFKDFQRNFNLFSESSLMDLDWNNVVAAGSAVTTALLPVPEKWAANKRSLREYYHEHLAPASDVDLFLYGLNEEQALEKIKQIEQSIKNSILHEVTTIRTKNAITIASQYPTRHVQIVLRLYDSVSQIITGFDVDCACAAYDGKQVYAAPRAIGAFITQSNTIDLTRRSPSYENRLSKYSHRGFEVHWPLLDRTRIDPTIFERSFGRTQGLARLLILEKLPKTADRDSYMDQRRAERGRPVIHRGYRNRFQMGGNIKDQEEDEVAEWVEAEEVASYHTMTVPYGPKYQAAKINRLLYAKDLLLNAEWNQNKEREVYLHRHPCFFGTAEEILEDCCGYCPVPKTEEELEVAEEESKTYISGKLKFLMDDPGRQEIGSFNPITDEEWTTMAYVGDTARLCQAIVDGDLEHVQDWCFQEGVDVNRRDYTGRTPLHLATMVSTPEIVKCLVDHGARLVARLVDGRTALHLAAARGDANMVEMLMDRSLTNEEEKEEKQEERKIVKRAERAAAGKSEDVEVEEDVDDTDSEASEITLETEDDESDKMTDGSFIKVDKEADSQQDAGLEDAADEPDFYTSVDIVAWDYGLSPLHLAILNGHTHIIELLASEYGADVMLPIKLVEPGTSNAKGAIMTLVLAMTLPEGKAAEVAKLLVRHGAASSQADMDHFTAFHYAVLEDNEEILGTLLEEDRPKALSVLEVIGARKYDAQGYTPLASAVLKGHEDMVKTLLSLEAKPTLEFDEWRKGYTAKNQWAAQQTPEQLINTYHSNVTQPIIMAADKLQIESIKNLLKFKADPQTLSGKAYNVLQNPHNASYYKPESLLDIVVGKLKTLQESYDGDSHIPKKPETLRSEDSYTYGLKPGSYQYWTALSDYRARKIENEKSWDEWEKSAATCAKGVPEKKEAILKVIKELQGVKDILLEAGAKPFYELHPNAPKHEPRASYLYQAAEPLPYGTSWGFSFVPDMTEPKKEQYKKLFEATWDNDHKEVASLTLSGSTSEPPLRVAVQDNNGFSPFSIAVLRGHHELARKIIQICLAQYHKDDGIRSRQRWTLANHSDDECYSDESDDEEALPIFSELVNDKFTIDDLGEVATQVKSNVLPLTMVGWTGSYQRSFDTLKTDGKTDRRVSLLEHAVEIDNKNLLDFLIKLASEQQAIQAEDDEDQKCYEVPQAVFWKAIELGRTIMLAELIKTTGAGMSLNHLVKSSGVEYTKKPKYYQGLSVGGKKRADWAQAPGEAVKSVEERVPPVLQAARYGSIDAVEWFMSDAPLRRYKEFAETNKEDKRIKTLEASGKTFETSVGSWLALNNKLVLHCAIMFQPKKEEISQHIRLIDHLLSVAPETLEEKTTQGWTPLQIAVSTNQTAVVSHLISKGANQRHRDNIQRNVLHLMLARTIFGSAEIDAKRLETMIALFDKEAVEEMFTERCNEHPSALTPLAYWMAKNTNGFYKKKDIIEVLSKYSSGEDLEMINGEGDLPLHVAIKHNMSTVSEYLLSLNTSLLYRENATGRTPLEMSRDIYIASCVERFSTDQNAYYSSYNNTNNDSISIIDKPAIQFVEPDVEPEETKKRTFEICSSFDAKAADGDRKRRLVSLFEANEVAKRVASVKRSRWGGNQVVVNGGLVEDAKSDAVGVWLTNTLSFVQQSL